MFGWDPNGLIVFNDVVCTRNTAVDGNGGCLHGAGTGIVNNGTIMLDNTGTNGGCICETAHFDFPHLGKREIYPKCNSTYSYNRLKGHSP